jgi:Sigma-70, region 4
MATFDQLSDEQRAIVELVLRQGKSYGELSDMLGLPEARVRDLARDALVDLSPITARGVEQDWRGQLADYVLGQQAGPEATATRGHLRRSEAARSWTRSLLDALEQLYPDGAVPAIPDGERGSRRKAAASPAAGGGGAAPRTLSPDAAAAVRRRRLVTAAGVGVLILVALLLWPVGLLTGGDDEEPSQASTGSEQAGREDGGPISTRTQGQAIIARQEGRTQILVTATGLEPSTQNTAYQVYLANSEQDRKSLGATVTDQQGNLQAGAQLPANFASYEFIDLSSVTVRGQGQNQRFEEGPTVLRGLLELRDTPVTRGTGKNRITLLGEIQMLPLPE